MGSILSFEVDLDEDGGMPGAKHAARRKLGHELGIPADQVPHEDFRYLGRFHYWAADTLTYGPQRGRRLREVYQNHGSIIIQIHELINVS